MRITIFIIVLVCCQLGASAQKKGELPQVQQNMPGRDSIVSIDNIAAGKSKGFHWHSGHALLSFEPPVQAGSFIDASLNGKTVLSRFAATGKKAKARKLSLKKGTNTLIIKPHRSSKTDSFTANLLLCDKAMHYNITAQMKKGKSDTLIIIKH